MDNTAVALVEVVEAEFAGPRAKLPVPAKPKARKGYKTSNYITPYDVAGGKHYFVQMRRAGFDSVRESFDTIELARAFRDSTLAKWNSTGKRKAVVPSKMLLADVFQTYVDLYPKETPKGLEMPAHMKSEFRRLIAKCGEGGVLHGKTVGDLGEDLMLAFAKVRLRDGILPVSVNREYGYLHRAVACVGQWLKWGGFDPLAGCYVVMRDKGFIKESEARLRVPSDEELSQIIPWMAARDARELALGGKRQRLTQLADFVEFQGTQGTRANEGMEQLEFRHLTEKADGTASWALWRKDCDAEQNEESLTRRRWEPAMPLVAEAYEIVKRQPTYKAWKALSLKERAVSTLRLFPISASNFGYIWRDCLAEFGITDLHFHDMRAKAITNLIKSGMMPSMVKQFSGHRTLKALDIYIRFVQNDLADMVRMTKSVKLNFTRPAGNDAEVRVAA